MSEGDIWAGYEPASFEVKGYPVIRFMLRSIRESGGQRMAPRARPFRPGAKLDTTGALEHSLPFEALFTNDAEEPGVTDDGGPPLWPDRLDLLVEIIDTGKTGTLNLPWRRGIRAKCHPWERSANADDNRGGEILTGTFIEDNEDNLDREAIVRPSARATLVRKVEETQFSAEAEGIWSGSLSDLTQLTSELIGLANAPGQYLEQVVHASLEVQRCVSMVRRNFSTDRDGRGQFFDPLSFPTRMRLLEVEDLAASAEADARRSQDRLRRHYPDRNTTIWRIATQLGQDAQRLMELNGSVEDFADIPKGTPIWVVAE